MVKLNYGEGSGYKVTPGEKLNLCCKLQERLGMGAYDIRWDVEATEEILENDTKGAIFYDLTSDNAWDIRILNTVTDYFEFTDIVLHELVHALMVDEYRCLLGIIDADLYTIYSRFNEVVVDRIVNTFNRLLLGRD